MKRYSPVMVWMLSISLVGCVSTEGLTAGTKPVDDRVLVSGNTAKTADDVEGLLRTEYQRWKNTPHEFAGNGLRGVDCSGLVHQLYKDLFNVSVPRSTATQIKVGTPTKRAQLQAGDLVFFKLPPPSYPRHVGIYLSDGEFLHASKSKGVIISKLNTGYWRDYYHTARRHSLK